MSLFSEAMKSILLTCSFSAVSMFTSTVLLAYIRATDKQHRYRDSKLLRMNSVPRLVKSIKWSTAHVDCKMCQKTMYSLRAERSDRETEGGKNKCLKEWRETSLPSDMCNALVCHLSSPSNICCSAGAERLTDENFTLSLCPTEQYRFEPMHLIKHLREGTHTSTHTWIPTQHFDTWVAA